MHRIPKLLRVASHEWGHYLLRADAECPKATEPIPQTGWGHDRGMIAALELSELSFAALANARLHYFSYVDVMWRAAQ